MRFNHKFGRRDEGHSKQGKKKSRREMVQEGGFSGDGNSWKEGAFSYSQIVSNPIGFRLNGSFLPLSFFFLLSYYTTCMTLNFFKSQMAYLFFYSITKFLDFEFEILFTHAVCFSFLQAL